MSAFASRTIHAGQDPEPTTGAVCVPISLATTFVQSSPGVFKKYEYSRSANPTRDALEACIANLENAKYALAFASGSAATSAVTLMLEQGDEIISVDDVYGGTHRYFVKVATKVKGMTVKFVDFNKPGSLKAAVSEKTKLVWVETPTNPTLKITDIKALCEEAHALGLMVCVDNTFATPYFQNPLDLGADIVVHSATKYINGHSDVVMGMAMTNDKELFDKLSFVQNAAGAIPAPFDCYMVLRGLKTLHLRMERHEENATKVAKFLESHDKIERVVYPGLPSHAQHEIAKKQMKGFGGMVTAFIKGGLEGSRRFLENLKLFALAESLGAVESLVEHPAIMTHAAVPAAHRAELGISDSLVRLSVGVEDIDDLLADLTQALTHV